MSRREELLALAALAGMALPTGKTCGDCQHWPRCKALIQDRDPGETSCDFSPSRFRARAAMEDGR